MALQTQVRLRSRRNPLLHQRLGTQPTAAISAAGIRGCTGVCRSDSLDKLMQEECVHFRVGAIWRGKRGPFLSF